MTTSRPTLTRIDHSPPETLRPLASGSTTPFASRSPDVFSPPSAARTLPADDAPEASDVRTSAARAALRRSGVESEGRIPYLTAHDAGPIRPVHLGAENLEERLRLLGELEENVWALMTEMTRLRGVVAEG